MVKLAQLRLQGSAAKTAQANGRKGGRPRKNSEALASRPLPGTAGSNAAAVENEAGTAPAGQPSDPVPVSAHGNAAEGGLLAPWYGPGREPFDGDAETREGSEAASSGFATSPSDFRTRRPGKSATSQGVLVASGGSERGADGSHDPSVRPSPGAKDSEPRLRYGSAANVLMTATEMAKLAAEFGDVRTIVEELSDYLQLHPNKYRSHYAALRNWCRRRIREGRNPDGTRMTQGDRLARHFAQREKEIIDAHGHEEE